MKPILSTELTPPSIKRDPIFRYGLAILSVALATAIRLLFSKYFEGVLTPFILFYPAVMLTVWYGGFWPGLLATSLSLFSGVYFFTGSSYSFIIEHDYEIIPIILFLFVSLCICGLTENLRRSLQKQSETTKELLQSRTRMHNILESIQGCFFSLDLEGRFIHVNEDCKDYLPSPQAVEALIGKSLWEVFGHWKGTAFEIAFLKTKEQKNLQEFEFFDTMKSKWYEVHLAPSQEGITVHVYDISSRKEAENALNESEGRFRLVTDQAPVMVWMSGGDALCNYFNEPWLGFRGRNFEEEMGNGWMEGIHPDDKQSYMDAYLKAFHARESFQIEFRLRRADGQYRWVLNHGVPRFSSDRKFMGHIGSVIDITDRKKVEDRQSIEYKVTQAMAEEGSPDPTYAKILQIIAEELNWKIGIYWEAKEALLHFRQSWTKDKDAFQSFVEKSSQMTFPSGVGLPGRIWAMGKAFWIPDIVEDPTLPRVPLAKEAKIHSGIGFPIMMGRKILGIMEFYNDEIQEPDSSLLQMFEALGVEIGQYIERRRAEVALRQTQEQLNLALESAAMGYWIWDLKNNEVNWSENLAFLQGLATETLRGTLDAFISCVHPDDRDYTLQSILQAVDQKTGFNIEFRTRWPDGSIHWISGRGQIFFDEKGNPERLMGFGLDISERKRAEEALKVAYEEMEKKVEERTAQLVDTNRALEGEILERKKVEEEVLEISQKEQRRLGAQVHDDLCQNLAGILILAKVLHQKLNLQQNPEAKDLNNICDLLSQSINQAKEIARGLYPVELQADSVMIALKDLANRMQTLYPIACQFNCPEPILIEDNNLANHLYRIAQEAVQNASRHGHAKNIEISLTQMDGKMVLTVRDDGKGMSSEMKSGTGIGLNIMKYRARMINGLLEIGDQQPAGTILTCSVPFSAQPSTVIPLPLPMTRVAEGTKS